MPAVKNYMPRAFVDLQRELNQHTELQEGMLQVCDEGGMWTEQLAWLAAKLDIVLDGYYTEDDISCICMVLTEKLVQKRTTLILPSGFMRGN